MTPTTTPAPMTPRDRLRAHVAESAAKSGSGAVLVSAGEVLALFADWEAERTRADALAARIAELEAGIGRLADEWYAKHAAGGHGTDILDAADELRSLIGHKEG